MNDINAIAEQILITNPDRIEEVSKWTDKEIEEQLNMYERSPRNDKGALLFSREFLKEVFIKARRLAKNALESDEV